MKPVSEEKIIEKGEVEFEKMLSQLSTEEVAEYQQEYLQLWEDGGLSSFTPTDDWESRDMDTPENELDEDSPKKPGTNAYPLKNSWHCFFSSNVFLSVSISGETEVPESLFCLY